MEKRLNLAAVIRWTLGPVIGAALTCVLVRHGLHRVGKVASPDRHLLWPGAISGCAAGEVGMHAAMRTGTWWLAPGLLVWACTLVAAATCDAITLRVPTSLVRLSGFVTSALLIRGLSSQRDWHGLLASAGGAAAAGLALWLCWRFAGVGFGDVRLAMLGGLGLGHATFRGLLAAATAFCIIVLVQAIATLARGGKRHSRVPFGPAFAAAFLLAAAL